jgi:hypothetical protein
MAVPAETGMLFLDISWIPSGCQHNPDEILSSVVLGDVARNLTGQASVPRIDIARRLSQRMRVPAGFHVDFQFRARRNPVGARCRPLLLR